MSSELAKLFGRSFIIGYVTPILLLLGAHYWINPSVRTWIEASFFPLTLDSSALAALFAILLSVLLLAVNHPLVQLFEGYVLPELLTPNWDRHRAKYDHLSRVKADLEKRGADTHLNGREQALYMDCCKELASMYPDGRHLVLPLKLGNIIRSFEAYPLVKYGIDAIPAWSRVEMLADEKHLQTVSDARAQFDFYFNLHVVGTVSAGGFLIASWGWNGPALGNLILFLVCFFPVKSAMHQAALNWGSYVKSLFDICLPKIRTMMGDAMGVTVSKERTFGEKISRWWIYRQ
jgi:hypothetical protein